MDRHGCVSSDPGASAAAQLVGGADGNEIMSEKKKFLLRLDADVYNALEKWAADDLRSVNAQIEYVLKDAVRKAGRLKSPPSTPAEPSEDLG